MLAALMRVVTYSGLAVAIAYLLVLEATVLQGFDRFAELGFVELTQAAFLTISVVVCLWQVRFVPERSALAACLAMVFAILLVRENDQIFELWLVHGFWKWPALLIFIGLLTYFIRHRHEVLAQLNSLVPTLAFGVLLAGFSTLVFARIFGSSQLWEVVMGGAYLRVVKQAAEEGTEVFALGLLMAGCMEMALAGRRLGRA